MSRKHAIILNKIIDEADVVSQIISNMDEKSFLSNEEKKRAVCMTLINIGELVKNIDDSFRSVNDHIPWREMAGLRDIAANRYQTLRMDDVWEYASIELPKHLMKIKGIVIDL